MYLGNILDILNENYHLIVVPSNHFSTTSIIILGEGNRTLKQLIHSGRCFV